MGVYSWEYICCQDKYNRRRILLEPNSIGMQGEEKISYGEMTGTDKTERVW
jgi:hypothetical protein